MAWTLEKVNSVLKEIQASVPESLRKNVVREVKATPTVEKIAKEAAAAEWIPEEKRKQIQTLIDNGDFSKTKITENPKIAKMIDNFVSRKINEAVRAGRLPNKKQLKALLANEKVHHSGN